MEFEALSKLGCFKIHFESGNKLAVWKFSLSITTELISSSRDFARMGVFKTCFPLRTLSSNESLAEAQYFKKIKAEAFKLKK